MAGRQAPKVGLDPDVAEAIEQAARQFNGNRSITVNWLLRQALGLIPTTPSMPVIAPVTATPKAPTVERILPAPPTPQPAESNVTPLISKADRFKSLST